MNKVNIPDIHIAFLSQYILNELQIKDAIRMTPEDNKSERERIASFSRDNWSQFLTYTSDQTF